MEAITAFLSCLLSSIRKLADRERQKEKRSVEAGKGGLGLATAEPEGYAECYPGLQEMNDAIDDSDDEVDYSKMDLVRQLWSARCRSY